MPLVKSHAVGTVLVLFAFTVAMLGTTVPSPLYPLYEKQFHLAPVLTPIIFATYALGVMAALLFLGYLSDEIGRRRMMFPAMGLAAVAAGIFLISDGLVTLLIGRLLSGISSGIASGAATAWLVDLGGARKKERSTLIAVAANVGGLALGPLMAGLLAGLAPAPLRLPYFADLALVVAATVAVLFAPETIKVAHPQVKLRVQTLRIPSAARQIFPPAAVVGVCAFAVAGVFNTVAPAFLGKELGDHSAVHGGLLIFLFFAMAAMGQSAVAWIPKQVGLGLGCIVLLIGLGLLAITLAIKSTALLFVAGAVSGLGEGLPVGFGLAGINEKVGDKRGETDSLYFLLLYGGVALPVVALGLVIPALGMIPAGLLFCGVVGVCVVGVLVSLIWQANK